jgi:putative tryptophan/tyrosine transport system substrate-binding protein
MAIQIQRREVIYALGGIAAAWPLASHAQKSERVRRIGILMATSSDDPEGKSRLVAIAQGLQKFGWTEGSNVHTEVRSSGDDADLSRRYAEELVALAPDVLVASASLKVAALQRATRSVPIVFANIIDPVGAGFVRTLAHPGGNTTGFTSFEYSMCGKWLELLKKLAPQTTRIAVLRDPGYTTGIGQFAAIQSAASSSSGIELSVIDSRDVNEIERELATFGREPNGGVIVAGSPSAAAHRKLIISLLTRYRLPNIYPVRYYPADGGLASYGPDAIELHKRAAEYVDRILKGAKPSELPVQAATKYELVLNLKAAKAIGLEVPTSLLTTADEVIE